VRKHVNGSKRCCPPWSRSWSCSLGVVVGGMIVAMYLPIFDMMNAVGG
jgi:hypothetical protein